MRPLILKTLLAFVLETQLKYDIENPSANIEIAKIADQVLKLLFFANLKTIFVPSWECLELFKQLSDLFQVQFQLADRLNSYL